MANQRSFHASDNEADAARSGFDLRTARVDARFAQITLPTLHRRVLIGQRAPAGQGEHRLRDMPATVEHDVDELRTMLRGERGQLPGEV